MELTKKGATVKRRSMYSLAERKKFPFIYITLLIPVVHIIIFFFYVNLSAILLAFKDVEGNWSFESIERVINSFDAGNYAAHMTALDGHSLFEFFGKSIVIWCCSHLLAFPVAILTSFMLTKHTIGSKFFRVVYQIPGIVGSVVFSTIMINLYKAGGPIMLLVENLGAELPLAAERSGLLRSEETAFITLLIQQFILGIAGGGLITAGAFMSIPEEIFESARLEGCGFWRETFSIAVPCIWPTISTQYTFALCSFFVADMDLYLYSGGTGQAGLISVGSFMYRLEASIAEEPGIRAKRIYSYASALGMLITAVTIVIVTIGKKILAKLNDTIEM